MLFGALMLMLNVATAQDCPFRVKFEVIPASCYNNGKVAYALLDGSGHVLTALPAGLSEVRAYYIAEGDTAKHYSGLYLTDSIMAAHGGWDTLIVDYGTYTVGLEAICTHSASSASGYEQVKKDTTTVLTIPTTYVKPSASALYVTSNTLNGYGKHPTLDCENTGRIQLKIENGRFPYTVTVRRHGTTDTLRTVVFPDTMYHGRNETRYDYYLYYSVDSLPAGDWDFYLVDGCDYGLPRTGQVVEVVSFPTLDYVEVYASSGNMQDSNVVKINAVLDKDYEYYTALMPLYAEYRFVYDGFEGTEWKPFPPVLSGFRALLRDTLEEAHQYCDIWNHNISLQYRRTYCGDEAKTKTFQLRKPNEAYYERDYSDKRDSTLIDNDTCTDKWYWHRWYHEIYYRYQDLNHLTRDNDNSYYRHHYTHPLTWIYTDTEKDSVIKVDVISGISSSSRLYDTEVENIYGSFRDRTMSNPLMLPIQRQLVDAHGCVLYTRFDSLPYCYDVGMQVVDWRTRKTNGDHCCKSKGSVGVFEHYHSEVDPDGTQIILEESPYNNRYNFSAVYSSETHSWTVTRDNLENVATISGGYDGLSMDLSDYCLPSGPYKFKVMTPCDTFTFRNEYSFPDIYSTELTEEPAFEATQQCTDRYITYTAGAYSHVSRNTSSSTGLPLPPTYTTLNTRFQIVDGPVGGYDGTLHSVGSPIRISMPGQYVVRIAPSSSYQMCDIVSFYDTIDYDGATVEFEYAFAYLCDSTSTSGNAYIKGINGTPPYRYTLYDSIDKQGNILGDTVIADPTVPAIFPNRPMDSRHQLSCKIEDACGAYFHVNFYPLTMADVQKIWFDDGLTVTETCEGSTISVHAMEIASILKYQWYNPDGDLIDSVSSPSIFIPRGADDGWYKVVIRNSGCQDSIVDSVRLTVKEAPTISLSQTMEICPGEEASLSFTPTSPLGTDTPMEFTIAFSNGDGIETRTYSTTSGVPINDTYITFTDAKIYPLSNSDGNCNYTWADEHDTIRVMMKKTIADACTLLGSYDTVCYGSDALFAARSTMEKPYTIRWYSDYELTHLLKEETMTATGPDTSFYDTLALTHHAEVFVAIEKDGYCPTVYGIPTNSVSMTNGSTEIPCGKIYRLYDDGGASGDYSTGTNMRHTYTTTDGKPVTIHFEELELSETAHLFIITGPNLSVDSILYDLTAGSENPGIITTHGNTLTLYFVPGMKPSAGWNAIVEHSPGMSVADVWKKNEVTIRDEVCQSQINTYDDPYGVVPNVVTDLATLTNNLRKAGIYSYTNTIPAADVHGCDSTVTFILTVNPPPHYDTTIVTTNLLGGTTTWHDNTYTKSGQYSYVIHLEDGCDSLDILDFIILQVDTSTNDICIGESTTLGVSVTEPEITWNSDLVPSPVNIGDVYCSDGSILKPDSFLQSDKTAKGIVFYVDRTGMHGLVVALSDTLCQWAPSATMNNIHSLTRLSGNFFAAATNMSGLENTKVIMQTAINEGDFKTNAPAAYYCYYYNHTLLGTNSSEVHEGWYLPSMGELFLMYANRVELNSSLNLLRTGIPNNKISTLKNTVTTNQPGTYWSSTEYASSNNGVWMLMEYNKNNEKNQSHYARPITTF